MQTILWIFLIFNVVYLVFFGIYYAVVDLNQIFTFDQLPVSSVPFYDPNAFWPTLSDRYNLNWFVYLSDILLVLPPFTVMTTIALMLAFDGDKNFYWVNFITINFLIGLQILKFIWYMIQYGFCDTLGQQCRPYSPSTPEESFGNTNFVFLWGIIYNSIIIPVLAIYLVFSATLPSAYERWKNAFLLQDEVLKQYVIQLMNHIHMFEIPGNTDATTEPLKKDRTPIFDKKVGQLINMQSRRKFEEDSTVTEVVKNTWNTGVTAINYHFTGKEDPGNIVKKLMFSSGTKEK